MFRLHMYVLRTVYEEICVAQLKLWKRKLRRISRNQLWHDYKQYNRTVQKFCLCTESIKQSS